MRRQKKFVSVVALVLAVLMVLGVAGSIITSLVASAAKLDDINAKIRDAESKLGTLESQQVELDSQRSVIQDKLGALKDEEDSWIEQINLLQEEITLLRQEIANIQAQVALYEDMIVEKEEQLVLATEMEAEQLELYKTRIRAMEERGTLNYIQVLLSSKNFSDLVTKISDINEILDYDQRVADDLEKARIAVEEYKADLEDSKAQLERLVTQLKSSEADLDRQINETQAVIDEIQAKIDANQIELEKLEAEKARIDAEVLAIAQDLSDLSAEKKAEIERLEAEAASTGSAGGNTVYDNSGSGMFGWPSNTCFVRGSGFGPRKSPGGIGSTNHQGLDIPAAFGTEILASASGTVSYSGWSGGYGNYVMINHGNGYYTAYAHMSTNYTSPGDVVVQGQVIGLVGSTGNSTGPHIHFEVLVNGTRVNPELYV